MNNDKFPEKWEDKKDKESSAYKNSWINRLLQVQDKVNQVAKQKPRLFELSAIGVVALILIAVMPLVLSDFRLDLLHRYLALAIVALGIDLIWGYTGLLSLGHGIFFALGGYAIAMHIKLQIPETASSQLPDFMGLYGVTELPWFWGPFSSFPFTAIAILLIPGILAAFLGYLVFRNRIRGVYFSILTQAATIVFFNFFNGQQKLFNGTNGLTDFQTLLGFPISNPNTQYGFYVITVILLAGSYLLCRWLTSGRFGRLLIAIRDDESRVRFSGYNPTGYKVLVFAISAALAGLGGALFTLRSGIISPRAMDIAFSIEMVIWVAVGGRATLIGAILGALLVNYGKSFLSEQFPEIWLFFQGALFLIVVLVLPNGIVGWLRTEAGNFIRTITGRPRYVITYPKLAEDPEIQRERETLEP
ncbi:urea ABC transporter permease subunit UrtC [Laspinema olomoucense]|uniref:urea ABC transporter permease subunit UrtC n=1 Tax=Laspinema olomoucense TaxID=3231600 RepID=UPI0021BB515C|nr:MULTISPECIES: urea ABC transporter permease subunit UrtC [unclassified Laspinema]MCT7988931.1 urea ABC transporter permease subunit UrtC [Laspinema sp. D3a]MCT7993748.1 urea ABC transporter permease subunit UrtC [Laspinema sp. D3c]